MSQRLIKKTYLFLMLFLILCIGFVLETSGATTVTVDEVNDELVSYIHQYENKRWTSTYYGAKECKGFATMIFDKIFDLEGSTIGTGSLSSNSTNYILNNLNSTVEKLGTVYNGSLDEYAELLEKAMPGDFLQVRRRSSGGPHSMIVVQTTSSGVEIFDCNTDGKCTVRKYTQSFSTFKEKNIGVSLYRSKHYSVKPANPTITSLKATGSDSVKIVWDKVSSAVKYDIYRKKSGDGSGWAYYKKIKTVKDTSYTDTGLLANTKYYYAVIAVNSAGDESGNDNRVDVRTLPEIPTITSATAVDDQSVTVSWKQVSGAERYDIYRKKSGDGSGWAYYKKISSATGGSYTDSGLEANTKYYYGVLAVNADGDSSLTDNRVDVTTLSAVTAVSLSRNEIIIDIGETYSLSATVTPAGAGRSAVIWESSDTSVASVNSGNVKGITAGTATVKGRTANGKSAECKVIVKDPYPVELNSAPNLTDGLYLIRTMQSPDYAVSVADSSAETGANIEINPADTKDSSQQFWVKYEADGYYTLTNAGSGLNIDVSEASTEVKTNIQQWTPNGTRAQSWQFVPAGNGAYFLVSKLSSKRAADISIGKPGKGVNLWLYTASGHDDQKFIPELLATEIELEQETLEIEAEEKRILTVHIHPEAAENKNLIWTSSDNSVATVSKGEITGIYPGTAVITAETESTGIKAVCEVTVTEKKTIELSEPDFVLPASLEIIEDEAFSGGSFAYVSLPEGVRKIGSKAFAQCGSLKYIYIPESVTSIKPDSFMGTSDLTILGEEGSYAQFYANKYGFRFFEK